MKRAMTLRSVRTWRGEGFNDSAGVELELVAWVDSVLDPCTPPWAALWLCTLEFAASVSPPGVWGSDREERPAARTVTASFRAASRESAG